MPGRARTTPVLRRRGRLCEQHAGSPAPTSGLAASASSASRRSVSTLRAPIAAARSGAGTRLAGPLTTSSAITSVHPVDARRPAPARRCRRTRVAVQGERAARPAGRHPRRAGQDQRPAADAVREGGTDRGPGRGQRPATRAAPTTQLASRHPSARTVHTASASAVVARRTSTTPPGYPTAGPRQPMPRLSWRDRRGKDLDALPDRRAGARRSVRSIGARTFDFSRQVAVMAIVNRTVDSFYDRGATFALDRPSRRRSGRPPRRGRLGRRRRRAVLPDRAREVDERAELERLLPSSRRSGPARTR